MVSIPQNLKGATVLEAHRWVVSTLDGFNEYVLKDNSGMDVTLSDITRGTVDEVQVMPAGSRMNPAPSYAFKPEHQPQKRIQQFSSRVMLPQGISPSVVHALEAKHGASYRFIASKMLSQRSRRQQLSPKGTRMLRSSIMADPLVRNNPIGLRQTPSGIRMARVIGDRGRLMDDAIVAEVQGYLEGNEIPFDIAASEAQFQQFTSHVVRPYLISARSNQALIRYLNETLLPHMLRLIDAGEFDADITEIGMFRAFFKSKLESRTTLKSAAGKDKVKKILSDQYETVVRRLATSPQDFYYGRNEALVAHPAFLFPHAAYFLLPPPQRLTGGTRAELFFFQAGEAPRYSVVAGEGEANRITQEMPQRMLDKMPQTEDGEPLLPIARVNNAPVDFSNIMNTQTVDQALRQGNVGQLILMASQAFANDGVLKRMFGLGAATPPSGLTEEESGALASLNTIVQDFNRASPLELFRAAGDEDVESFPLAAAIEVNIGGIKPKPMGWPEGLIFSTMQVLSENAENLMRTEGHGMGNFFRPNISGLASARINLNAPDDLDEQIEHLSANHKRSVENAFANGITLEDIIRPGNTDADINNSYPASIALYLATNVHGNALTEEMIPDNEAGRADAITAFKTTAQDPTTSNAAGDNRLQKFTQIQRSSVAAGPQRLSLLNIMQLALTRFKQDGGNPTPEQVTFVTQLTMFTLTNLNADFEAVDNRVGIMDALQAGVNAFGEARQEQNEELIAGFIARLDERVEAIPEENELQQAVMDRLLGDLLDDLLAGRDIADVFENPRRNPPLPKLSEIMGEGPKDMEAIKRARDALRRRSKGRRFASPFAPDEATVARLSESLRGVFQQALAEVQEEREQAEAAIARETEVTRVLGDFEARESLRDRMNSYQQSITDVERALRALIASEQQFVEAFEKIPMDPTMELDDNLTRQEMFNHPLYIAQNLFGQHKMFMDQIRYIEAGLRTTLSVVRGEAVRSGVMEIHAPNIEYLMAAMEFCNGLQEEYANVGSSLGAAVDDMRVDDKDSISPHLYIALFDVADNFSIREGVRSALRRSSSTTGRSVDPTISEPAFRTITAKSFDLIGTLFGAFPGNVPTHPPNQIMDMGKEYLNDLVDADLDFSGDMQSEHRRGKLIAKAVSLTDSIERRMKRQLEGYYEREARIDAFNETVGKFSGGTSISDFFGGIDAEVAGQEALRVAQSKSMNDMFASAMQDQSNRNRLMEERRAIGQQMDYDKELGTGLFRESLTTPGSGTRKTLEKQRLEIGRVVGEYASPAELAGLTQEDRDFQRYEGQNRMKLETMYQAGEISQKELALAKSRNYHYTTVMGIKEGQRKGREQNSANARERAAIREVKKALKKAPDGFTIDTPENILNDFNTLEGLKSMPTDRFMRNVYAGDNETAEEAQERNIIGRNPPVVHWSE